jgi:hypothetical protein
MRSAPAVERLIAAGMIILMMSGSLAPFHSERTGRLDGAYPPAQRTIPFFRGFFSVVPGMAVCYKPPRVPHVLWHPSCPDGEFPCGGTSAPRTFFDSWPQRRQTAFPEYEMKNRLIRLLFVPLMLSTLVGCGLIDYIFCLPPRIPPGAL